MSLVDAMKRRKYELLRLLRIPVSLVFTVCVTLGVTVVMCEVTEKRYHHLKLKISTRRRSKRYHRKNRTNR